MAEGGIGPAFALSGGVSLPRPGLPSLCMLFIAACSPYRAGSFRTNVEAFPTERSTLGCVDLGMRATLDPVAEGPVIELYLGNRCSEAVWIDVPSLAMSAYLEDGHPLPVDFYDPRDELKTALLGGKEAMVERIELVAPLETVRVCARIGRLASSSHQGPPKMLCATVEGGA